MTYGGFSTPQHRMHFSEAIARDASDTELMLMARQGHTEALYYIAERHRTILQWVIRMRCARYEDVQDIWQNMMLNVLRNHTNFNLSKAPRAWFIAIAKNAAVDYCRRLGRDWDSLDALPLDFLPVLNEPERSSLQVAIKSALMSLPEEYRQAFVGVDIEGYRESEVARQLQVAVGTIKSRRSRAKNMLRKRLNDSLPRRDVQLAAA